VSLKKFKDSIVRNLNFLGIDPFAFRENLKGRNLFKKEKAELMKQLSVDDSFTFAKDYPLLRDRFSPSGNIGGHYFQQDLFVAQRVFEEKPRKHVDIGSRVDGFIAHLATFREVEVFDIRPQTLKIPNIQFKELDFMADVSEYHSYTDSISCLHAIEHFGLGRYGDSIDAYGHVRCLENLHKVLDFNGRLYLSTPIGPQRIEFNAHRVFSVRYLLGLFEGLFRLESFSYIDDEWQFYENVSISEDELSTEFGCHFGCGIFELAKI